MIIYRNASLNELRDLIELAAAEGWNPGLDDPEAFFAADPEGFFAAFDGETHCGGISVVNHNPTFAFLGLYLMRPEYRGRGIGLGLWKHAIAHAGARTIGLDGVEDQQANYARSGFLMAGNTVRYSGSLPAVQHNGVREARDSEVTELVDVEARASGARKPRYLGAWFQKTANRRTIVFEAGGRIEGFCTFRECLTGTKVGPLFAEKTQVAKRLLETVSATAKGAITLDVPASSQALDELCKDYAMQAGFRTARMYRGSFSPGDAKLFAVGTLELG